MQLTGGGSGAEAVTDGWAAAPAPTTVSDASRKVAAAATIFQGWIALLSCEVTLTPI